MGFVAKIQLISTRLDNRRIVKVVANISNIMTRSGIGYLKPAMFIKKNRYQTIV